MGGALTARFVYTSFHIITQYTDQTNHAGVV